MSKEKKTEVAVQSVQSTAVATSAPQALQGLLASDVIIPQLLLMQGLSDFVAERKAQLGDIVKYPTAVKMGDPEHALDFIPLAMPKSTFVLEQKNAQNKYEYRKVIPRNADNERLGFYFWADKDGNEVPQGTNGATEWRRVKKLAVFAILVQDILDERAEMEKAAKGEMPDLSKSMTPVMISFRIMSYNAGRDIVTFFTQAASFKMAAWKYSLKLSCSLDKNDQGTFYVYNVDRAHPKPVPADMLGIVEHWANLVSTTNVQVAEDTETEAAPVNGAGVC